ncbi:MAG TPA: 3-deoxy-D-manno-octulosonic acid transferase [Thiotrichaceae bacterium]|nr:3-deoxy-D-manno-octulosonic acid transferase [Thiotrichaceae bacterium]HIM08804.1 3-deoxy-D-manno-octulosonic acid transferase [Gammaproteobacteria bacterium]
MRLLYTLIVYLLVPFVLLRLFWLGLKNPAYRIRWQERFGFFSWTSFNKPVLWIHAVSVGEVNAATPIINRLLDQYSHYQIIVTTVTPTGAVTLEQHFDKIIKHLYLPYDLPYSVKRFLNIIKPSILITMETEIWPNLYYACQCSDIPILIINARLSEKSSKGYRMVSSLMKQTLMKVDVIAAQTKNDAERFISFGADKSKVYVTGNLKFDISIQHSITEQAQSLKRYFSVNRPVWIAASTQEGEEEIVLGAHKRVLEKYPDTILILAPRHPDRVNKVTLLCDIAEVKYIKRTEQKSFSRDDNVYLLDTLGELQLHYAASQIAFVGGSLVKTGGQNMMEPASLGLPVISGLHTYNFTEITDLLLEEDALAIVSNELELANEICVLLADANRRHNIGEKGRQVIEANKGNIDRLMEIIAPYLKDDATYENEVI